MAELLTQDLSLKAGAKLLVREANLHLVPGELVALLGPNGAGKPSLLRWPNTVRDVVALGRFAYGAAPGRLSAKDAEAVDKAMGHCGLTDLSERNTDTLSGGELARVHCARAFAADAPLLVADEPVAALDPRHQFSTMDIIRQFVGGGGGALVVLHDIALAARYATRMVWMKDAQIVADGPPEETLTPGRLAEIYGVQARVDGRTVEIEGTL